MKKLLILLSMALIGCDTPSPHFRGIEATQIVVDGSTFDVRVKGDIAEAIRTNSEWAPRMGPIAGRAERAIETVSGCKVKKLGGDAAVIVARLDC